MKKFYKLSLYAMAGLLALMLCFTVKKDVWAEPDQNQEEIQNSEEIPSSEPNQEEIQDPEQNQEEEEIQEPSENPEEEMQEPEQVPDQDRNQVSEGVTKHTISYIAADGTTKQAQGYYLSELLEEAGSGSECNFFALNDPETERWEVYIEVDYKDSEGKPAPSFVANKSLGTVNTDEKEMRRVHLIIPQGVHLEVPQIYLADYTTLKVYQGTAVASTGKGYLEVCPDLFAEADPDFVLGGERGADFGLEIYGGVVNALTNNLSCPAVGVLGISDYNKFHVTVGGNGSLVAQSYLKCGIRCGNGDLEVCNTGEIEATSTYSHGISAKNITVSDGGYIKATNVNNDELDDVYCINATGILSLKSTRKFVSTSPDFEDCICARSVYPSASGKYNCINCAQIQFDDSYVDDYGTILNMKAHDKPVTNVVYSAENLVSYLNSSAGSEYIKLRRAGMRVYKHSATMDNGTVYLNFFVHKPSGFDVPTANFTVNSDKTGSGGYTRDNKRLVENVTGTEIVYSPDSELYFAPDFYKYSVQVNPIEMADNVKAAISTSGIIANDNYSLVQYYEEVKAALGENNPATKRVRTLLTYGKYTQQYLAGYHGEEWQITTSSESGSKHNAIEGADFELSDSDLSSALTELQAYKADFVPHVNPASGCGYYSKILTSVSLESNIGFRFRIIAEEGKQQDLVNKLIIENGGSLQVFESTTASDDFNPNKEITSTCIRDEAHDGVLLVIHDICYQNLNKEYDIMFDGSDYFENLSPLSYAALITDPSKNREVDYAMASLYLLYDNVKSN